jgi:hypothetical protein
MFRCRADTSQQFQIWTHIWQHLKSAAQFFLYYIPSVQDVCVKYMLKYLHFLLVNVYY